MRTSVCQWCIAVFSGNLIGARLSSDQPARPRRPVLTSEGRDQSVVGNHWKQSCELPPACIKYRFPPR